MFPDSSRRHGDSGNATPDPLVRALLGAPHCRRSFANACNIVLADGIAEQAERDFINRLQQLLGLDNNSATAIVQVMVIKNQG